MRKRAAAGDAGREGMMLGQPSQYQYSWEKRIYAIKKALYCRVHPDQEFRQIVVSTNIKKEIEETTGVNLLNTRFTYLFSNTEIVVDDRLPDNSVIFIPTDPHCKQCSTNK